MKKVLFLAVILVAQTAMAKDISLKGLNAKALFDTISSEQKLEIFNDGGMGKRYIEIGAIHCSKSTIPNKEIQACTFKSQDDKEAVSLYSDVDGSLDEIRFVLSAATHAERQESAEVKALDIKKLSCKLSGLGHVLDASEIELKYSCQITI